MTASKFITKLLILWYCNLNSPTHLTNVDELTFPYLQRRDNFPIDRQIAREVSKGVTRYIVVTARNQISFFIALTSLFTLYSPLLSFSPSFGAQPLQSVSVILVAVVGPFVFLFLFNHNEFLSSVKWREQSLYNLQGVW